MPLPQQASSTPIEKPSTSETAEGSNLYPKDSTPAADISDLDSKVGATSIPSTSTDSAGGDGGKLSAEQAAEKLYEERIEEEYAKREGGA